MLNLLTVSDCARRLREQLGVDVRPRDITTLLYQRAVPDSSFPIVGGRRLIPSDQLVVIENALRRRGHLPSTGNGRPLA